MKRDLKNRIAEQAIIAKESFENLYGAEVFKEVDADSELFLERHHLIKSINNILNLVDRWKSISRETHRRIERVRTYRR